MLLIDRSIASCMNECRIFYWKEVGGICRICFVIDNGNDAALFCSSRMNRAVLCKLNVSAMSTTTRIASNITHLSYGNAIHKRRRYHWPCDGERSRWQLASWCCCLVTWRCCNMQRMMYEGIKWSGWKLMRRWGKGKYTWVYIVVWCCQPILAVPKRKFWQTGFSLCMTSERRTYSGTRRRRQQRGKWGDNAHTLSILRKRHKEAKNKFARRNTR